MAKQKRGKKAAMPMKAPMMMDRHDPAMMDQPKAKTPKKRK